MTRPWYPFYWSDYSGKTFHLTQGEHGAYMLLLRQIYTTGKPIPEIMVYSVAKATLDQERSNVDSVLEQFFFKKNGWQHRRASEIMQQAEEKHKKLVESGSKGGKARSSHPQATLKRRSSKPQPQPHPEDIDKSISIETGGYGFESFWKSYPTQRRGSKDQAKSAWLKAVNSTTTPEEIMAGCLAYAQSDEVERGFAKGCAPWIRDERWRNDYSIKTKGTQNGRSTTSIHQPTIAAKLEQNRILAAVVAKREQERATGMAPQLESSQ